MGSNNPREEYVFLAAGSLTDEGRESVAAFLGEQGLATSSFTLEHFVELAKANKVPSPKPTDTLPPLDAIQSRDDYIVREHFEEFREEFAPQFGKRISSIAFNGCLDTFANRVRNRSNRDEGVRKQYVHKNMQSNEPTLRTFPSLIVKTRVEIGFPEPEWTDSTYRTNSLARYAIQVGSFIDLDSQIGEKDRPTRYEQFLSQLIHQLENQIDS